MNPLDPRGNWMAQGLAGAFAHQEVRAGEPREPEEALPRESFLGGPGVPGEEREIGQRHEEDLAERYGTCEDEATAARLERLAGLLLPLVTRTDLDYRFRALDTELAFASACPNGTVFFSRGLLAVFPEDPPLLFFGAHELTHTERGHYATRRKRFDERMRRGAWTRTPEERAAVELAAVAEVRHQEEYEADRGGVEMLERLGYGPEVAVEALERLYEAYKVVSPRALETSPLSPSSHPTFPDRLRRLASPDEPPPGQALRNLRRFLG